MVVFPQIRYNEVFDITNQFPQSLGKALFEMTSRFKISEIFLSEMKYSIHA